MRVQQRINFMRRISEPMRIRKESIMCNSINQQPPKIRRMAKEKNRH
jgi:hypothetical protein